MYLVLDKEDLDGLKGSKDLLDSVMLANKLANLVHRQAFVVKIVAVLSPEPEVV